MTSFITQVATVSLISLTTFFLYIKYKLNANIAQIKKLAPSLPIVVQTFHFVHPLFQRLLPTSLRAISTDQLLNNPYQYYKILGSDNFILVHAFGYYLHVADYSIAKEITTSQSKFPKAPEMYRVINLFGPNIVGTEGVEWRRHRKIAAPQFGEKTNQLVAYEVNRTCNLMFQSWNKKSIDGKTRVDIVKDLAEFALCIFSGAAFGKSLDFGIDSKLDDGHLIDYKTSVTTVATNIPLYLVIPNLLLKSPIKFFRNVDLAMEEFKNYLNELIDAAKAEKQVRDNLLSKFVDATFSTTKSNFIDEFMTKEEQLKSTPLSRQELVGGFETTAGTLTSALTVLSIHPEIQLKMHQEAIKICGKNDPTYSHLNQLHYICAVVHETLRMFPPVSVIPKMVSGDQKLGQYIIPGETRIAVHVGAIHRNPINFEDPDTFKPERWIQEDGTFNNSIKLLTFSDGARACIGKQFARVEMVFAMCLFAQRWKWSLPDGVDLEKLFLVKSELTHKLAYPSDLIFQEI